MKFLYLLVTAILIFSQSSTAREADKNIARQFVQSTNLVFVENKGQITDQNGQPRPDIDFKLRGSDVMMFIGDVQLHYQWYKTDKKNAHPVKIKGDTQIPENENGKMETYRLDVSLVGANKQAKAIVENKQEDYERYYTVGCENGAIAHTYQKITYKDVYPSIDWVLYTENNQLKYDFIVRPGGKVSDIKIKYEGATDLVIKDGALIATTPMGSITEQAPYSYTLGSKQQVSSTYLLDGDILSFDVAGYTGTLVIDPQLDWATYYGGVGEADLEGAWDVATDAAGNVFICGETNNNNNIATAGAFQTTFYSSNVIFNIYEDGFIVKFSNTGARLWATYYGAENRDYLVDIACDALGNVYAVGSTSSYLSNLSTPGSFLSAYQGHLDPFLVKFDGTGARLWATYVGGVEYDYARGVCVDPSNNVYVCGYTNATTGTPIGTPGAHQTTFGGGQDGFLTKFNSAGVRQWGTYYGGSGDDYAESIICDNAGNVYMCGRTTSAAGIATPGSYQPVYAGNRDDYLVKFDANGVRQWGTYYGGVNAEGVTILNGLEIAYDPLGNIYMIGETKSTAGIATPGTHQNTNNGDDLYFAKFNLSGALQWCTYYGGSAAEYGGGVSVAPSGAVIITGSTFSTSDIATPGAYQSALYGGRDVFNARFTPAGVRTEATYYGGWGHDYSTGIAHDANNNFFISGYAYHPHNLATPGSFQSSSLSPYDHDAFLAKWHEDTTVRISMPFSDTNLCSGQTFQVPYGTSHLFNAGNVFTVQLSDASGSFASPVNVGTLAAIGTAGIINCTLPPGTTSGNFYRVRIVSSNPVKVSPDTWVTVSINSIPAFTASNNGPVCEGGMLQITLNGTLPVLSYSWTGPGSFSSNLENPFRLGMTPAMAGTYTVTASLGSCVSPPVSTNVTVTPLPAAPTAGSNSPVCAGGTINLTSSSSVPGVTYSWTGPFGFGSIQQNPSISNVLTGMGGTYTVTTTLNGCSSSASTVVTVSPAPAGLTAASNSPVCAGSSINLTSNSTTPGVSYSWTGPGTYTSNLQNPIITNATTTMGGSYTVTAVAGGCSSTASTVVTVNPSPAGLIAGNNGPVCLGNAINLTGSSTTPGVSYSWVGPNSFTSNQQNPVISNAAANMGGAYTLTATLGSCSNTHMTTVIVSPTPAKPTAAANTPVCASRDLYLTGSSTTPGVSYSWTGPNSFTSNQQNPVINNMQFFAQPVEYILYTSLNGCLSEPDTVQFLVELTASAPVAGSNSPICVGDTLNLWAAVSGATAVNYIWSGPNNFSHINLLNTAYVYPFTINDTGVYKVSVAYTSTTCASDTTYVHVTAGTNVTPVVNITANPGLNISPWTTVTFTASSVNGGTAPTYQWLRNGLPVAGATGSIWSTYELADNDAISVIMTSNENCVSQQSDTSNVLVVNIKTGIDDQQKDSRLTLYPNPNNGDFTIKGDINEEDVQIEVFNALGQIVYSEKHMVNNSYLDHNIHLDVASGVYLLKLTTESNTETITFRKQ